MKNKDSIDTLSLPQAWSKEGANWNHTCGISALRGEIKQESNLYIIREEEVNALTYGKSSWQVQQPALQVVNKSMSSRKN